MELIVKAYSDKPSRIGIKYGTEYAAVKAYEEIFHKDGGDVFSLKLELLKERLELLLISDQTGARITYKALEYKLEQLKKLQNYIKPGDKLELVHIFSKENTLMVARAFRSNRFIRISHYEIVGAAYFTSLS